MNPTTSILLVTYHIFMQETLQKNLFYVFKNLNLDKDAINAKLLLLPMQSIQLISLLLDMVKIMMDQKQFLVRQHLSHLIFHSLRIF